MPASPAIEEARRLQLLCRAAREVSAQRIRAFREERRQVEVALGMARATMSLSASLR